MPATRLPGSFRDPAGHVFLSGGTLYRRIEPAGQDDYRRLMQSGLYEALAADGLLIPHEELGPAQEDTHPAAIVIRPERVPLVSYPYEWCFSQLRDAALLMLRVQRRALEFGMSLKDASAFNVQFWRGRPVLIDTLSFEGYVEGPWVAYRQFCQHFYGPLLLWCAADPRLARLSQTFIDGVPLGLTSRLLPRRSWLRPGALLHIHLHATAERRFADRQTVRPGAAGGRSGVRGVMALVESLERAVSAARWTPGSEWTSYYADRPSYGSEAFARKLDVVGSWLDRRRPHTVWDLGANTGRFSRLAARHAGVVAAFDADASCVETLYKEARAEDLRALLPLVADLTSPSPAIGWANEERLTLEQRGPADLLLALALVHHLALGNNVPLPEIARYLARLGRALIVEFVPRSDAMVAQMMRARRDVFERYTAEQFEQTFAERFRIEERVPLTPSERILYLMTAR